MTGTIECISIGLISLLFIKIYALFYKTQNERENVEGKQDAGRTGATGGCSSSESNVKVDIICDITNNFGRHYVKEVIRRKNVIGIIPVYKNYNKEYLDISKFNSFMAQLFNFLNMRNGKLILANEDNCVINFLHKELNMEENDNDEEEILLASCIIINDKVSIIVCVINYEADMEKQLNLFIGKKKKDIFVIINNLFLSNKNDIVKEKIKNKSCKNVELLDRKSSLTPGTEEGCEMTSFFSFFDFFNIKKEFLTDFYSIIQINMKNFCYFYKRLGNNSFSETYLNGYMYDNLVDTKIYNSLMDMYHDLISEAIKKDKKKINMRKFYTFYGEECDYNKIVKFTLMKLENNMLLFYIYDIYSYVYYQLILYFSQKQSI
ncbi:conserved Plasmodium protein, unknown function [Plasmodium knowlesi strain H]|uniref:Uncharacterized protein n=3 Tax=Plasmodium knowlesi TaxID=5850 RepID=A0A5K1UZN2_PLAKH|nr:conserved Plasmodium protein, unknown function [Plasmodium knowlesi strain H]OTN65035.1 Uncharacterized protein PKNOH_S120138800 [Plasmodium knowlesi]CAA9988247.1 conserved Plasmodium protein, unknown function [Plasmodium knowlesi strain H]SBO20180.1 conserved Plasmodium protein, unknown function [Plasmodium knowlesi strain H]SBO20504.1 conserved Plasmodium protein, unknown function [Plasmodium knowlesi strain H]VVS77721.1 conserved Plasmodium protein, unknown function [Plasmodium knowlesi |eukprot:XP_002259224.1 hypothetical protein, conserved in Plasmodium species [Plasmodium knowlesi strain H]